MNEENYLGYIKYDGELVANGLMDARRQAKALLGFDSALRFFIEEQAPSFRELDFEIPVRVKKGSWEALIPETVGGWVQAGLGIVATAYLTKAAQKLAENDFGDLGIKDIFSKSIEGMQWFVKIGKHMGDVTIRQFQGTQFRSDGRIIGIPNDDEKLIFVPKKFLDLYVSCPPKLLEGIADNVTEGRDLKIGAVRDGATEEVIITPREKHIFCEAEDDLEDDTLFPELIHGDRVELQGEVTRENKIANSMGFKYKNHILTAYPESGNIVPYKPLLFLKCKLFGIVNRHDEKGRINAKRPKLYFSRLEPLSHEQQEGLF